MRWCVVLAALSLAPSHAGAAEDGPAGPRGLVWQNDLQAACRAALGSQGKVLVRVGAEWCGWCQKLDEEIERPEVQQELRNFSLVYLDADKDTDAVRRLGVGPIPALRVLSPGSKTLAMHDGFLPAAELAAWLRENSDGDAGQLPDVLTSAGPLDDTAVRRLLNELTRRESPRREAAIGRLQSQVDSAADVVDLLRSKKLAARLSALELLRVWRAPIEGLDPWRAETISQERLDALGAWAETFAAVPEDEPLPADELAAARRDIDGFLKADQIEAEAIAARLARYGHRLMEEVYARLKETADDRERERLTWLRYRLVATDAVALGWPGGLARLAANDSATRHQAAQELAARATADDEPLFLEMFSDPDPLVRELSLKALHAAGGQRVSTALAQLLYDPEPNVRAAVLKELAQAPSPAMVPTISKYLAGESDADLVVHAVRLLRATGGLSAVRTLMKLLEHASWRVRAEAAEALGECASSNQGQLSESVKADAYIALIDALDDEDGFVVSRAMLGLRHADVPAMIEPLASAAEKRPELAKTAAQAMTGGQHTRTKALDRLWKWTDDDNDELRIAGLVGLCSASAEGLGEAFEKALADPSAKVRVAAAEQVFKKFEEQRPYSEEMIAPIAPDTTVDDFEEGVVDINEDDNLLAAILWQGMKRVLFGAKSKAIVQRHGKDGEEAGMAEAETRSQEPADEGEEGPRRGPEVEVETPADSPAETSPAGKTVRAGGKEPDPWEPWLAEMRSDEGRPKWAKKLAAPLEKMLAPDHSAEERWAAALALVPLAQEDRSLPVLRELIAAESRRMGNAAHALPWLPWEKRLAWFDELKNQANSPDIEIQLVHSFTLLRDLRGDEPLWQVLGSERVTPAIAQELLDDLKRVYRIGQPHYGNGAPPVPQLDVDRARNYATAGTNWQRLAALALLLAADEPACAEVAGQLFADERQSDVARLDALQFLLLAEEAGAARERALESLRKGTPAARRIALAYLARGPEALRGFRQGTFHVASDENNPYAYSYMSTGDDGPVAPEPPEGLAVDDLRPFLADADPALAAFAGYLLTQLGEAAGLEPLLKQWRADGAASKVWTPLVYHAIAALDDARYSRLLVEIYDRIDQNAVNVRDFYWTIRTMTAPDMLELRKRIRDEVGMEQLR